MIYLRLFWEFFKTGLFAIGGGMATLPFLHDIGEATGWFTQAQLMNMLAVSESTPGPIGVNAATFVGTRLGGVGGALIATAGCVLPSCVIAIALSVCYKRLRDNAVFKGVLQGLRPAVVALIASAGLTIALLALLGDSGRTFDWIGAALFAASLFVLRRFKPNPIWVMLGAGVLGMGCYLIL